MENKKIIAIAFMNLGIIILTFFSIKIISTKFSLPPYSFETEGKYVVYGIQVWTFLWTMLIVFFLFLAGYLVFPSMFRRFYAAIRAFSVFIIISGLEITTLLFSAGIVNKIFPLFSVTGSSPFWIMAILAILAFKKSTPY